MSAARFAGLIACFLLLTVPAPGQLDPAASKLARKELALITKSAAFDHRVRLYDAAVNLAVSLSFPVADAELGTFDGDSPDTFRDVLDGWMRDVRDASLAAAQSVAAQIPLELEQAFGGADLGGELPRGYRPGDGDVLDKFRALLSKQQAKMQKAIDKGMKQVGDLVRKKTGVSIAIQMLTPEVAWAAGSSDAGIARLPRLEKLDLIITARGGAIGTRVLLAGNAEEAPGDLLVELLGTDGVVLASHVVTPQDGRWTDGFQDVAGNPPVIRVSRAGMTLAERCLGIP
jgi:hypothetical protein